MAGRVAGAAPGEFAGHVQVGQGGEVGFDAVQNAVEVDAGQAGADTVETGGGVQTTFAHAAVVHEPVVEFGLDDLAAVVAALEFAHVQAVTVGVFFQFEVEVARFGFLRPAPAFTVVA